MPPQAPFENEKKCFKTFRVKLQIYVQGNCLVTKATLEVSAPPCLCEKESSHSSEENFDANSHACIFLYVRVLRMQNVRIARLYCACNAAIYESGAIKDSLGRQTRKG